MCLIGGSLLPESDPIDGTAEKVGGKKKSKVSGLEERMKTMDIQVLIPEVCELLLTLF